MNRSGNRRATPARAGVCRISCVLTLYEQNAEVPQYRYWQVWPQWTGPSGGADGAMRSLRITTIVGTMFIAYKGRGALIPVIAFLCLLASEYFTDTYFHDDKYYTGHWWPKLTGMLAAALLVWLLSATPPPEEHAYLTPGEKIVTPHWRLFRESDSLFWIPVRHWPWILCVIGGSLYFV